MSEVFLVGGLPSDGSEHMVAKDFVMQDCMDCIHYHVCKYHSVLLKGKETGKLPIDFSTASCLHYMSESVLGEGLEEDPDIPGITGDCCHCGGGSECGDTGRGESQEGRAHSKVVEMVAPDKSSSLLEGMTSSVITWCDKYVSNLYTPESRGIVGPDYLFLDTIGRIGDVMSGVKPNVLDALSCQIVSQMAVLAGKCGEDALRVYVSPSLYTSVCELLRIPVPVDECSAGASCVVLDTVVGKVVLVHKSELLDNEMFSEVITK